MPKRKLNVGRVKNNLLYEKKVLEAKEIKECCICWEEDNNGIYPYDCKHIYHSACFNKWRNNSIPYMHRKCIKCPAKLKTADNKNILQGDILRWGLSASDIGQRPQEQSDIGQRPQERSDIGQRPQERSNNIFHYSGLVDNLVTYDNSLDLFMILCRSLYDIACAQPPTGDIGQRRGVIKPDHMLPLVKFLGLDTKGDCGSLCKELEKYKNYEALVGMNEKINISDSDLVHLLINMTKITGSFKEAVTKIDNYFMPFYKGNYNDIFDAAYNNMENKGDILYHSTLKRYRPEASRAERYTVTGKKKLPQKIVVPPDNNPHITLLSEYTTSPLENIDLTILNPTYTYYLKILWPDFFQAEINATEEN